MKPEYWIGIMAVAGAIVGYALFKSTGWFDTGIGTALGVLVGVIIYSRQKEKQVYKREADCLAFSIPVRGLRLLPWTAQSLHNHRRSL